MKNKNGFDVSTPNGQKRLMAVSMGLDSETYIAKYINNSNNQVIEKDYKTDYSESIIKNISNNDIRIGDSIVARRKVKSKIYHNMVIGPVMDVFENCIVIICNQGTDIETSFQLFNNDWNFEILNI